MKTLEEIEKQKKKLQDLERQQNEAFGIQKSILDRLKKKYETTDIEELKGIEKEKKKELEELETVIAREEEKIMRKISEIDEQLNT